MRTSKKHTLALPIAFILAIILKITNWTGWNALQYNDKWFGWEFQTSAFIPQSIIVIILSIVFSGAFEYFQQKDLVVKPSRKDTITDIIVSTIFAYLGFLIAYVLW